MQSTLTDATLSTSRLIRFPVDGLPVMSSPVDSNGCFGSKLNIMPVEKITADQLAEGLKHRDPITKGYFIVVIK